MQHVNGKTKTRNQVMTPSLVCFRAYHATSFYSMICSKYLMNKCTITNADRAHVFLRLAEDYCKGSMERKRSSPTHQKYQAPSTERFSARSACSGVVVRVNFMSAWGAYAWWNLGPTHCQFLKGKDRAKKGRSSTKERNKDLNNPNRLEMGIPKAYG